MVNASESYQAPNLTFFLPTGPMVNTTMDATLLAVEEGRKLGLNVHWVDMRRTCVGLVHQTHDDAESFCEVTIGLGRIRGRIAALYFHSSNLYQIH